MWPLQDAPQAHIKKNAHLADMLVAHIRALTRGFVPFALDWSSEQTCSLAGGDIGALEYMRTVGRWVKDLGESFGVP